MRLSILYNSRLFFWCPGCDIMHSVPVDGDGLKWSWNRDLERPTLAPSVKNAVGVQGEGEYHVCHFFLTDGVLHFCNDCTHSESGKALPLPDIDQIIDLEIDPERGLCWSRR